MGKTKSLSPGDIRANVMALDLECIKFKLVNSDEGPGWSREKVEDVCVQYRRFLFLCATVGKGIVPTKDIDEFWHYHILDTRKYAEDCEHAFGFFLHHFPYLGMRGEEDAALLKQYFENTKELYHQEFGVEYGVGSADCENCGNCDASCGVYSGSGSCASEDSIEKERPRLEPLAA